MNGVFSLVNGEPNERLQLTPGLAIVTGSRGQDGSYLRDLIGQRRSIGCVNPRQNSTNRLSNNEISIDLGDKTAVFDLLSRIRPTAIFHLAAKHGPSTRMTYDRDDILAMKRIHVEATRNFLECIDELGLDTHLVVAGSSRVFTPTTGRTRVNELSEPNPTDYYGESKLEAWELIKHHRQEIGARACFLILFNHESPRRPPGYFSHDIADAINHYRSGRSKTVVVRDADFFGDWSDARDVTKLMGNIAASQISTDFVVASGQLRSVRDVVNATLMSLGKENAQVESKTITGSRERNFLEADIAKSIELKVWNQTIKIEETIAEMVSGSREQDKVT
jgi:GDPmannose 4,6-dehydratase